MNIVGLESCNKNLQEVLHMLTDPVSEGGLCAYGGEKDACQVSPGAPWLKCTAVVTLQVPSRQGWLILYPFTYP